MKPDFRRSKASMPLPSPDDERAVGSTTGSHARPAVASREPAAPKPDKPSETLTL